MLRKKYWLMVLVSVLITLLALLPIIYSLSRHFPPRIATVDLQKLIEEDQEHLLKKIAQDGPVTQEQRAMMQMLTADFARKMSHAMETLGKECGCVLVNKSALLGGSTVDYTNWIRKRVQE